MRNYANYLSKLRFLLDEYSESSIHGQLYAAQLEYLAIMRFI